jgi:hypothetical protein
MREHHSNARLLAVLSGFAVIAGTWASVASGADCKVDIDCNSTGLMCGGDVCTKGGMCVPAGSDPGTCNGVSDCKCYGPLSVLCDPETHSCTITSPDGGIHGGIGTSDGGTIGQSFDAGSTTGGDDAGMPEINYDDDATDDAGGGGATSGSTSESTTSGASSGTLTASSGSSSGSQASGSTVAATGGSSEASGTSAPPASKKSSGCSVSFGGSSPLGLFGLALGACVFVWRARRKSNPR